MALIVSIFRAILNIALYGAGFLLVVGLFALGFYLFYDLVWLKIKGEKDKDSNAFEVCLCCSFLTVVIIGIRDGSFKSILDNIVGLF